MCAVAGKIGHAVACPSLGGSGSSIVDSVGKNDKALVSQRRGQLAQYLRAALRLAARLRHRALTAALLLFLCRPGPPPPPGRGRALQIDRLAGTVERGGGEAAAGWDVVGWWRHHTSILIHAGLPPHGRFTLRFELALADHQSPDAAAAEGVSAAAGTEATVLAPWCCIGRQWRPARFAAVGHPRTGRLMATGRWVTVCDDDDNDGDTGGGGGDGGAGGGDNCTGSDGAEFSPVPAPPVAAGVEPGAVGGGVAERVELRLTDFELTDSLNMPVELPSMEVVLTWRKQVTWLESTSSSAAGSSPDSALPVRWLVAERCQINGQPHNFGTAGASAVCSC